MRLSILYGILILFGLLCVVYPSDAAKIVQDAAPQLTINEEGDFSVGPNWSDMFDWKLLKAFKSQKNRNVIVSPLSLKIVLALLYGGSAANTKEQLKRVLHFHDNSTITNAHYETIIKSLQEKHSNFTLNLGTRIFMKLKPEQKFQSIAKSIYNAEIDGTDFDNADSASKHINEWAEHVTEGHIRRLVHPEDLHDLIMLVVNAIYFKGTWQRQFPHSLSHRGQFYILSNNTIHVDYMAISDYFYYADSKELQARIVRVPYEGNHYVMYFMLPNYKMGLSDLLENLNPDVLRRCLNLTDLTYVDLVIPKFRFDFQTKMDDVLIDLGLDSMFGSAASFPGIVRGDTVKVAVSSIIQKAGIIVNEEGTTAFAATDVQVVNKFGDVLQGVFNATHPFLFFIEDRKTGTILFSGKVENPIQSDPLPLETGGSGGSQHISNPLNVPSGGNKFGQNSVPLSSQSNGEYLHPTNVRPTGRPQQLPPQQSFNPQLPQDLRVNPFDFELLKKLDRNNENVLISPASIKATLAMLLEGARGESARQIEQRLRVHDAVTARQLIKEFIYGLKHSGRTILEAGHGIFVSDHFEPDHAFDDYRKIVKENYKAFVDRVDFGNPIQATYIINAWISKITNGMITDALTPDNFNPSAGLVLASALYFKGDWKYEFNPSLTQERYFQSKNRGPINVNMMQITETFNYDLNKELDAHVVELPYSDDTYSMLLIVPRTKRNNNIASDLLRTNLNQILGGMDPTEVILHMPKFDIDYSTDLRDALASLGVSDIFSKNANLSGIVSSQRMSVDALVHRARIEVGEKGTIAASVTVASVVPLIGSSSPLVAADHPFAFIIFNKAKQHIIFAGVVNEPTEVISDRFSNANAPQNIPNNAGIPQQQPIKPPQGQKVQQQYQPVNTPIKGSGRTNPIQVVPGVQQRDQQHLLRTSSPIRNQPPQDNFDSYNY